MIIFNHCNIACGDKAGNYEKIVEVGPDGSHKCLGLFRYSVFRGRILRSERKVMPKTCFFGAILIGPRDLCAPLSESVLGFNVEQQVLKFGCFGVRPFCK